jgi:DNA-binding Lrp family transcriptional regulator
VETLQNPTNSRPDSGLQIDADTLTVYSAAFAGPGALWDELGKRVELSRGTFGAAVERLLALGLLERSGAAENRLYAVAPTTAIARLCRPVLQSMAEGQQQVSHLSSLIASFTPAYLASLDMVEAGATTERLMSLEAVQRTISELSAQARHEVLTSQPGGPRPEEQLQEALGRTDDVLRRGVRMRTLYQRSAQFSQVTVRYVHYVTRLGAQVRTVNDAFMRLIVFDQKTAVMSLRAQEQGALIVHDPDIVHFAVQAYERAWAASQPFPTRYERQQVIDASETVKESIMRLLVEGLEVAVIAKRLGVSHRTCQRHISEIMLRLGARNRLQAGYLIGQLGLLANPEGSPSP